MELFMEAHHCKTYSTRERARVAVTAIEAETKREWRWIMGAAEGGRVHPIFLLKQDEMVYVHYFIRKGFCIAN